LSRLGICFVGNYSSQDLIRYAKAAEENNYESVWIAEDLGMRDAIGPFGSIALSTRHIKLATGILAIYYRSPGLMAMTIATLDELSGGRMILGLGNGIREWVEQQGLEYRKPLVAMKEYVEVVRRLLEGSEVTFDGRIYKLSSTKLHFKPPRRRIPVYIAARGPRMLQLAGEIGDGVLNSEEFCTPKYFEWARENMKEGSEKSGRDPHEVDLASYVLVSVSEDHDKAKETIKPRAISMLANGALHPALPFHLDRMGLSAGDVSPAIKSWKKGDIRRACEAIPDSVLDLVSIYGTPRECANRMREFRSAGVDLPIVSPVGSDILGTIRLAKDL